VRIGHGYDVHKLVDGRKLILGGVDVPFEKGLLGHSDADVLIHAVIDSLLGAAALGNIGQHFPDDCKKFKDINSLILLENVYHILSKEGFTPINIDSTIICQKPKLSPFLPQMAENIRRTLCMPENTVCVKAKTEEGLGFTGHSEGVAAHAVVLIRQCGHKFGTRLFG